MALFLLILFLLYLLSLGLYNSIISNEISDIMRQYGEEINYFSFYFNFDKFKNFLIRFNGNEINKNNYLRLYKKAVLFRKILYFSIFIFIIITVLYINIQKYL